MSTSGIGFPYEIQYFHVRYIILIESAVFACKVHYPVRLLHPSKIQYDHNVLVSFEHIFIGKTERPLV